MAKAALKTRRSVLSTSVERAPLRGRKVNEIATAIGGAAAVFSSFNLDLCRDGDVALEAAAQSADADLAALEQAISATETPLAPPPHETTELITYIVKLYHESHRRELPELLRLAKKVEAIHADHPSAPRGLADTLKQLLGEIEVHMKKEELVLFPAMRRRPEGGALDGPISQMRHDHDDHGSYLRWLESKTGNFTPPEGACGSWRALYSGLAKFRRDLIDHLDLENNVLFPRFEQVVAISAPSGAESVPLVAPSGKVAKIPPIASPPQKWDAERALAANPLSGASLVPMLIAGLVFTVIAMIVALALS